jgi:hypothetical protein
MSTVATTEALAAEVSESTLPPDRSIKMPRLADPSVDPTLSTNHILSKDTAGPVDPEISIGSEVARICPQGRLRLLGPCELGQQGTVRTFSRWRPKLERRDATNSLWTFGWRGTIITACNNNLSEQTLGHRLVH